LAAVAEAADAFWRESGATASCVKEGLMATVRWDPLGELSQLQDRINRVMSDAYDRGSAPARSARDEGLMASGTWTPPVDIYQQADQALVLRAELPDMSPEDIELTIDNETLTIKGEKRPPKDVREEQYHRIERRFGTFSRSFSLPQTVDPARISAEQKNGVLTVRLPVREEAKPRQIKVDVSG
jgi:HSP20 family protein